MGSLSESLCVCINADSRKEKEMVAVPKMSENCVHAMLQGCFLTNSCHRLPLTTRTTRTSRAVRQRSLAWCANALNALLVLDWVSRNHLVLDLQPCSCPMLLQALRVLLSRFRVQCNAVRRRRAIRDAGSEASGLRLRLTQFLFLVQRFHIPKKVCWLVRSGEYCINKPSGNLS